MSDEPRYFWVPLDIDQNPLWDFAVPSDRMPIDPPGVDVLSWLKTASVPEHVLAKWAGRDADPSDAPPTEDT